MDAMLSGMGAKIVELSQDKWMKLAISILIDIIGILTFLIPVVRAPFRPRRDGDVGLGARGSRPSQARRDHRSQSCARAGVSRHPRCVSGACRPGILSRLWFLILAPVLQLAEMMDVFWAPLSALLVHQLYGSTLLSGVALIGCEHPFLPHASHPLPGVGIRPQLPRVTGIPQIGTASAGGVGAHL
jgi:hypothetical protein